MARPGKTTTQRRDMTGRAQCHTGQLAPVKRPGRNEIPRTHQRPGMSPGGNVRTPGQTSGPWFIPAGAHRAQWAGPVQWAGDNGTTPGRESRTTTARHGTTRPECRGNVRDVARTWATYPPPALQPTRTGETFLLGQFCGWVSGL